MVCLTDEIIEGVAVLTLRRPAALNAISQRMIEDLEAALDRHEADETLALVITGEGRAFCAGSDLKEPPRDVDARVRQMHALALRLIHYPKLSVAAINGLALGGGLEIAMACTLRVATPEAKLGLPEVKLAVMPGYGGTQLLPRLVGSAKALELLLTGDFVSGEDARAIGLVTAIEADVVPAAVALARKCTVHGQPVQQAMRRAIYEGAMLPLPEGLALEQEINRPLSASPEAQAAIAAFAQRSAKA